MLVLRHRLVLREPRVAPAVLADLFSRPEGPAGRMFQQFFPRLLDSVGGWLAAEVRAGRIRALHVPLLIQQLIGPLAVHLLFRPALMGELGSDLPSVEDTCTCSPTPSAAPSSYSKRRRVHLSGTHERSRSTGR